MRDGTHAAHGLRRAEAVEAAGIICPIWIAEIGRAAGEGVGLHRLPCGMENICAGFHNNNQVAIANNIETKAIRMNAEVTEAGQSLAFKCADIHMSTRFATEPTLVGAEVVRRTDQDVVAGINSRTSG